MKSMQSSYLTLVLSLDEAVVFFTIGQHMIIILLKWSEVKEEDEVLL